MNKALKMLAGIGIIFALIMIGCSDDNDSNNNGGNTSYSYACTNGTAVTSTDLSANSTDINCSACDDGYDLSTIGGTTRKECVQQNTTSYSYACSNGTAVTSTDLSANSTDINCDACDTGYDLSTISGTTRMECVQQGTAISYSYACTNGTAVTSSDLSANSTDINCDACDTGYDLSTISGTTRMECVQQGTAISYSYACTNGTAVTSTDLSANSTNINCSKCNELYGLETIDGTIRKQCVAYSTISLSASDATSPLGIWSDGTTIWSSDHDDDVIYAYNLLDGSRESDRDITPDSANNSPTGMWGDGTTLWVAQSNTARKIFAYTLADGSRDTGRDITVSDVPSFGTLRGIVSDGVTMWVSYDYFSNNRLYAYVLADGTRDSDKDLTLHSDNAEPRGLWTDGTTMWVVDNVDDIVYAYNLSDGSRNADKDIAQDVWDLWSDGMRLYMSVPSVPEIIVTTLP